MVLIESSSGVGGASPSDSTHPIPLGPTQWDVAIDTPVSTLNDLKSVLIDHLGEKKRDRDV